MKMVYENWSREIFHGFYGNSYYALDNLLYDAGRWDECDYDYIKNEEEVMAEIGRCWTEYLSMELQDDKIIRSVKFHKIWSPTYYNYSTDRVQLDVDFGVRALCRYCFTESRERFEKYLRDNWTSYDGFLSSIPNNVERFKREYKNLPYYVDETQYIQVMLEFYLLENVDFDNINCMTAGYALEMVMQNAVKSA